MTRFVNPVPQFFDDAGNVLAGGKLYFYETGTTTLKNTYSDSDLSTPNTNPVILDGEGRVATGDGEIFLSGDYKVRLTDSDDVQLWERDPVSSVDDLTREWSNGSTYNKDQIVIGSDTLFYISLTDNNTGNDPTTDDGSNWTRIQFLQDWAKGKAYVSGEWVVGSDNLLYIAKTGSLNIDPTDGDTDTWFIYRGGPVLQPTNVTPVDEAISVPIFPTLTGDAFQIAQGNDDHILSNWQISSDDAFSSIVYDSAFDKDRESHLLSVPLLTATEYWWRVKYAGSVTGTSEFSEGTSFTTQVGPANQFSIDMWTGNGSTQSINNSINFNISNGLVWIKSTSKVADHNLVDTISGSQKYLVTNNDGAESTDLNKLTSFDSNGYTIGGSAEVNENTEDYVGFTFIQRSGFFDIVKYTGDINATQKINHYLGSSIGFIAVKANGATNNWIVKAFDTPEPEILRLNTTDASAIPVSLPLSLLTPTNFTVGFSGIDGLNSDGVNYTAYIFAQNAGNGTLSGTYTGTGAALKITTGFDTQLVLIKNTSNASNWVILDAIRDAANPALKQLNPNLQDAESALASGVDFLSDGFELQGAELELNAIGDDYLYLAIADPTTL